MKKSKRVALISFMTSAVVLGMSLSTSAEANGSVKDRIKKFETMNQDAPQASSKSLNFRPNKSSGNVSDLKSHFETWEQKNAKPGYFKQNPMVVKKTEDEKRIEQRLVDIKNEANEMAQTIRKAVHDSDIADKLVKVNQSIADQESAMYRNSLVLHQKIDARKISAAGAEKESKRLDEMGKSIQQMHEALEDKVHIITHTEDKMQTSQKLIDQLEETQKEISSTLRELKGSSKVEASTLEKGYNDLKNNIKPLLEHHKTLQSQLLTLVMTESGTPPYDYQALLDEEKEVESKLRDLYGQEQAFFEKLDNMKKEVSQKE